MTKSSKVSLPKGFFITGTDTGVGKTIITAYLLNLFKNHGVRVGVMKPLETGINIHSPSDAKFLIQVGALDDPLETISPYRFKTPAAPQVASIMEQKPIEILNIQEKFIQLCKKYETLLVEGVGGLLVPIKENCTVADLAKKLNLPLIIVTHSRLGNINHTLMTLESAQKRKLKVHGIVVNDCHRPKVAKIQKKSLEILKAYSQVPLIGHLPYIPKISSNILDSKVFNKLENYLPFKAFSAPKDNYP